MTNFYEKVCKNLSHVWIKEWNSPSPDVPLCFQFFDGSLYLLIYSVLCIPYLFWLFNEPLSPRRIVTLSFFKIMALTCLLVLQLLELVHDLIVLPEPPPAIYCSNIFLFLSLTLMLTMILLEKRCDAINSGFYFNFWVLFLFLCLVRARTAAVSIHFQTKIMKLSTIIFIFLDLTFAFLSLGLSCFSDKLMHCKGELWSYQERLSRMDDFDISERSRHDSWKQSKVLKVEADNIKMPALLKAKKKSNSAEMIEVSTIMKNTQSLSNTDLWTGKEHIELKECPETYAAYISRISFFWFTSLIIKGYKRPLDNKDLWMLNDGDYCRDVVPTMLGHLQKNIVLDGSSSPEKHATHSNTNVNSVTLVVPTHKPGEEEEEDGSKKTTPLLEGKSPGKEKDKFDPCLLYALLRTHGFDLVLTGFYKLIHDSLQFLGPLFLKLLLDFVSDGSDYIWKGYLFAVLIFVSAVIRSFLLQQYFHIVYKIGMRIRSSMVSIVYRKAMVLSTASRKDSTVGEIVNLMSVDSQKFLELTSYIHMLWSGPFQIIVALVFLWYELGPSVLAGLAVMLLLIPVNGVIGSLTRKLQGAQLKVSDQRVKMMNEILNGIKVLKLYAWENSFMSFVSEIRNKELHFMRKTAYLNAAMSFTFNCAPFIVSLTTFGVFVLVSSSNILTAEKAFVSLSLFNILRFPLLMLPMVISNLIQASVSLKRLTNFLKRGEIDAKAVDHSDIPGVAVQITNGHFDWDECSKTSFLRGINISVPKGHLVAIVGPVGCGKSSILSALLGEIHKREGSVNVNGLVAYVPQQTFIINATVRENILFGQRFEPCKYEKVLSSCCLVNDLKIFKDSDLTEIGEKGITLSGGQKQRISLARACYSDAQVILLDDPLSAVDSHVGKDLIDHVLGPRGLLADRTRVLVTHNLSVLPLCDKVFVMDNGEVSEEGSYDQLIHHAGPFSRFLATHLSSNISTQHVTDDDQILKDIQVKLEEHNESNSTLFSQPSSSRDNIQHHSIDGDDDHHDGENMLQTEKCNNELTKMGIHRIGKENGKLIEDETAKIGNVRISVYMTYFRSVGLWISAIIMFLFIVTQVFSLGSNLWLVRWSRQSKEATNFTNILRNLEADKNATQSDIDKIKRFLNHQRDLNLGIYGLFGLGQASMSLCASVILAYGSVRAAKRIHGALVLGVMRYPMKTFESVPLGRIINRFSSDINTIGSTLPYSLNVFLIMVIMTLGTFIMIALPNLWILVPLVMIIAFYVLMQRVYVATSRQLKRLESVSKSPIYSHFGETLQGVSSIRAYDLCHKFIDTNDERVDVNLYAYYANVASNRWLAVILEFIGNVIVFLAALFSIVSIQLNLNNDAGLVGLSVSYALSITQTLNWLVRMSSDVESNIVSVERIEEYANMEPEAPWEVEARKPGDDWPRGDIQFVNYSTRYREGLDMVLDNINFTIKSGEKVGIVGRTGSGKSSLVLALFRILESCGGEILIDGIPIQHLGLHDIRGRLTIIPQDPVLFSGTLRKNLDPFITHSDDEVWKVLELTNLKTFVMNTGSEGLDMIISEGGENLSVGQRQLVCLARALLRRTTILVLDEATAAVDLDTDDLIQKTIRSEFKTCTIVTIAHRLNTVLDYDKILVLQNGRVLEMDSPSKLLSNPDSQFYGMAKSAKLV